MKYSQYMVKHHIMGVSNISEVGWFNIRGRALETVQDRPDLPTSAAKVFAMAPAAGEFVVLG